MRGTPGVVQKNHGRCQDSQKKESLYHFFSATGPTLVWKKGHKKKNHECPQNERERPFRMKAVSETGHGGGPLFDPDRRKETLVKKKKKRREV